MPSTLLLFACARNYQPLKASALLSANQALHIFVYTYISTKMGIVGEP